MRLTLLLFCALLLSACAQTTTRPTPTPAPAPAASAPKTKACEVCGVVTRIETLTQTAAAAPPKPVLGGIVGGVVSAPQAKPAATSTSYRIHIRMDDGSATSVVQKSVSANLKVGARVVVQDGRMTLLR